MRLLRFSAGVGRRVGWLALGLVFTPVVIAGQSRADRRLQERIDDANRREAEVLVELADKAMAGGPIAADFRMTWRHDFLKASPGTFVPFTVTLDASTLTARHALMYVRAARLGESNGRRSASERRRRPERYAFDAIFPVELSARGPLRVTRGFAVPPGEYDVIVALKERPLDVFEREPKGLKSAVLRERLSVPDFWTGELTTSTVMLADRIEVLAQPLTADEAVDRPYAIGQNDVHVAATTTFPKDRELIVVFVIYNPAVTDSRYFDLQVDYHLFYRGAVQGGPPPPPDAPAARAGERYVTRTNPQRFNPSLLGAKVDPAAGHPVLAGQGILLSSFAAGEYRLEITVTDLVSRKKLTRDVTFRVVGS